MKRLPLPNRALALPLVGLLLVWGFSMLSQYVGMTLEREATAFRPSQWVFLAGVLLASFASLIGRGWAVRADREQPSALAHAAFRFGNLALVISMATLVIFAFSIFMQGFNDYNRTGSVLDRFVWLYLPIIVSAATVVTLILRAFVFGQGHSRRDGEEKPRMTELQKALALGYAVPIVCTAFAVILGLFIYDATRTNLQTWVWVIIIAIVGFGVIAGTRFAAKARAARSEAPRPRTALAAGAASLNFVLSIVFGVVVSILGFALGSDAMSKLQYVAVPVDKYDGYNGLTAADINAQLTPAWYFNDLLPAKLLILLAVVGIYLSITERNRERGEAK